MERKETIYTVTLTEHQLRLIADCVEDCSRFAGGQMELFHTTCMSRDMFDLHDGLARLQPLMTPELPRGASYGWDGGGCPDDYQRRFIAETYYIYREILHQLRVQNPRDMYSVYDSPTLTCDESGSEITIKKIW